MSPKISETQNNNALGNGLYHGVEGDILNQ